MPTDPVPPTPAWLLLLFELPAGNSSARVAVWRRLRRLGAVALGGTVYGLPEQAENRESFEWLREEIVALGGQATLVAARAVDAAGAAVLESAARAARAERYGELRTEAEAALAAAGEGGTRRRRSALERRAKGLRQALRALAEAGGAGDPEARRAEAAAAALERALRPRKETPMKAATTPLDPGAFRARRWLTRPRPGVDRMASAWLIRRFVDPQARFEFAAQAPGKGGTRIPFDMFGAEFGHHDGRSSFEVIAERFGVREAAVAELGRLVHAIDLHEEADDPAAAELVERLVAGLRAAHADDHELIEAGIRLFEALYAAAGAGGPRAGARTGARARTAKGAAKRRRKS